MQSVGMQAQNKACFGAPKGDISVDALERLRLCCVAVAGRLQGHLFGHVSTKPKPIRLRGTSSQRLLFVGASCLNACRGGIKRSEPQRVEPGRSTNQSARAACGCSLP
jgi:hypothetical protein